MCLYAHTYIERNGIQLNFSLDLNTANNHEFKTAKLWLRHKSLMKKSTFTSLNVLSVQVNEHDRSMFHLWVSIFKY